MLNFQWWETLEFKGLYSWSWVKTCSLERSTRWYKQFFKKMILKGTCPILKFWNFSRDFSTQKRVHGLKFSKMALFLTLNTMTLKFCKNSKILVNLGIISESHPSKHWAISNRLFKIFAYEVLLLHLILTWFVLLHACRFLFDFILVWICDLLELFESVFLEFFSNSKKWITHLFTIRDQFIYKLFGHDDLYFHITIFTNGL